MRALDSLRAPVKKILGTFGTEIVYKQWTGAVTDPATSSNVVTYAEHTPKARISSYTSHQTDGEIIQHGDQKVLIAAAEVSFTPSNKDKVVLRGVEHDVVRVKRTMGTDEDVLFEVQARL